MADKRMPTLLAKQSIGSFDRGVQAEMALVEEEDAAGIRVGELGMMVHENNGRPVVGPLPQEFQQEACVFFVLSDENLVHQKQAGMIGKDGDEIQAPFLSVTQAVGMILLAALQPALAQKSINGL